MDKVDIDCLCRGLPVQGGRHGGCQCEVVDRRGRTADSAARTYGDPVREVVTHPGYGFRGIRADCCRLSAELASRSEVDGHVFSRNRSGSWRRNIDNDLDRLIDVRMLTVVHLHFQIARARISSNCRDGPVSGYMDVLAAWVGCCARLNSRPAERVCQRGRVGGRRHHLDSFAD